jgi:hypothetical protein
MKNQFLDTMYFIECSGLEKGQGFGKKHLTLFEKRSRHFFNIIKTF